MISRELQAMQPVKIQNNDSRVAVLLAGYGEVQSYRALSLYNQAATKYNDAVLQFPASVLAKQLNFVPAQTLDIKDLLA